jgi:hypothetical protein
MVLRGRDISSVLQIPEHLYGRETELKTFMTAFHRVSLTLLSSSSIHS